MTQVEFLSFVRFTMPDLYRMVKNTSYEGAMFLKSDLQKAMAVYSKGKQGKLDRVQEKAIAMMMKLEKWVKLAFIEKQLNLLKKTHPGLTDQGRKSIARNEWEKYNKKMSY